MTQPAPVTTGLPLNTAAPRPGPGGPRVLAEFPTYPEAQRLVDELSDAGFPVEHVRIVGSGIHSVEQVTGRLTKGRAALAGAATGAWMGLFIGLVFGLFAIATAWLSVLLGSVVFGAFWGALFGFVAHWATRGRRDFASIRSLEAEHYAVQVDGGYAAVAALVSKQA